MHVRFYIGYLEAQGASIVNDWRTVAAQDLNTGNELVGDVIVGDVTMDLAVIDLPRQ